MKELNSLALHKSLKFTRKFINISFTTIFIVLLIWGNYNPAAAFAMIFYNALYWILLSNHEKGQKTEINILKLTFTVAVFLHLILSYGFLYKLTIKITDLKILPLILTATIILLRYISYFYFKIKLQKK